MSLIEEQRGNGAVHSTEADQAAGPSPTPQPIPTIPLPIIVNVSGLYRRKPMVIKVPDPIPIPFPRIPPGPGPGPDPVPIPIPGPMPQPGASLSQIVLALGYSGELRLDVDGRYPQMVVSGTLARGLASVVNWIAHVSPAGVDTWTGTISYKEGNVSILPQTQVTVSAVRTLGARSATAVFSGGGVANVAVVYPFVSSSFHDVELEFDCAAGTAAVTTVKTGDHPNRPAGLPLETVSIESVYRRAGFNVTKSGGDSIVPMAGAGADAVWSTMEMHDAMQAYWSRFANTAQWSAWTFFAALSDEGVGLGGIMFDDIGPNHRQGTAIFEDAFISEPPAGDANPAAWVQRMRFWTAVHELGHAFNLAHSWQKALVDPATGNGPWVPLVNEPEIRSFMNYPFRVSGGQTAFFADFAYRFSDQELLFLRHAPSQFVQQGNADWFDHHGFQQAEVSAEPALRLELRVNRPTATFEFLEPVNVELKLTNVSAEPVLVPDTALRDHDGMTVIVKRQGAGARQHMPYAHYCLRSTKTVLFPGQSVYGTLLASVGKAGWDIADPGRYLLQVALHLDDEDVVSNPLVVKVTPPAERQQEFLAQDYFTGDVGRILTFAGSRELTEGNDALRDVAERMPGSAAARHAAVALGQPYTREYKRIVIPGGGDRPMSASESGGRVEVEGPDLQAAGAYLAPALLEQPQAAAQALGHITYKRTTDRYVEALAADGNAAAAADALGTLEATLERRGVLPSVVAEVAQRRAALSAEASV